MAGKARPTYYNSKEYIERVRAYIETFSEELQYIKGEHRIRRIKELIREYLEVKSDGLVRDQAFRNSSGAYDSMGAMDETVAAILGYGILTKFLEDSRYDEIQVNGAEVWVEQQGMMAPALDANGKRIKFNTLAEQEVVFTKLLKGTSGRTGKANQLVNGRTEEGYRVAVVDKSVHSPDPKRPYESVYSSAVIRKFSDVRLSLSFMITLGGRIKPLDCDQPGTFSDNMAKFFKTFTRAWISWITTGPTASGKTTTNSGILEWTPDEMRVILSQNPSEINMRKYKNAEAGDYDLVNNVLHLEAEDDDDSAGPEKATLTNIMNHCLRLSPVYVVIGEARTDMEFKVLIQKISLAGHPFNTTGHAGTAAGSISRIVSAVLGASPNLPLRLVMENIAEAVDIIIVQRKQIDKSRRVLQVTEVMGAKIEGANADIELNDLFKWTVFKEADLDPETGRVVKINGWHVRCGKISDRIKTKYINFGVHKNEYAFIANDVDPEEVETYSGRVDFNPRTLQYESIPEEFFEAARKFQGKPLKGIKNPYKAPVKEEKVLNRRPVTPAVAPVSKGVVGAAPGKDKAALAGDIKPSVIEGQVKVSGVVQEGVTVKEVQLNKGVEVKKPLENSLVAASKVEDLEDFESDFELELESESELKEDKGKVVKEIENKLNLGGSKGTQEVSEVVVVHDTAIVVEDIVVDIDTDVEVEDIDEDDIKAEEKHSEDKPADEEW